MKISLFEVTYGYYLDTKHIKLMTKNNEVFFYQKMMKNMTKTSIQNEPQFKKKNKVYLHNKNFKTFS